MLPQLLHYMRDTPAGLHILFSKLDISDGFWRLIVHALGGSVLVQTGFSEATSSGEIGVYIVLYLCNDHRREHYVFIK